MVPLYERTYRRMFPLFSFQELDLSAETLLKNVTPKEDEWLKIAEQGLHPKAQYTKVMAKVLLFMGLCLVYFAVTLHCIM